MTDAAQRPPLASVALLSSAALATEILLSRAFAVVHWHHFAYMIISLALLGFGASGTFLALAHRRLLRHFAASYLGNIAAFGVMVVASPLLARALPFQAEALLWDPWQPLWLVLLYLVLSTPFFCAANAIGHALVACRDLAGPVYAADLVGAGVGSVAPVWEARSDWEIYKGFAQKLSELCPGHLGVEKELVLTPLMHDSPAELAQPLDVKEWKRGEVDLIPGKTAPQIAVVERDYPNVYRRFTALGPLMGKVGNGGKGIAWNTQTEVKQLGELNGRVAADGATRGMPRIETDIDACEVILQLARETNGHVAVKAWEALGKQTGRGHAHLALHRAETFQLLVDRWTVGG